MPAIARAIRTARISRCSWSLHVARTQSLLRVSPSSLSPPVANVVAAAVAALPQHRLPFSLPRWTSVFSKDKDQGPPKKPGGGDDDDGKADDPSGGDFLPFLVGFAVLVFSVLVFDHLRRRPLGLAELSWQVFRADYLDSVLISRLVVVGDEYVVVWVDASVPRDFINPSFPDNLTSPPPPPTNATADGNAPAAGAASSYPVAYFTIPSAESFHKQLVGAQDALKIRPEHRVPVKFESGPRDYGSLVLDLVPMALFAFVVARGASSVMKSAAASAGRGPGGRGAAGKNPFQMGKLPKENMAKKTDITFKNVAGMREAKAEIKEFVEFLRKPERFTKLGAKVPAGAILMGAPGTGKTLLAKAVAGEAETHFVSCSGSDFVEMFVGVGPARIRDLFKQAREVDKCIIFIDEIDAIGRPRGTGRGGGNEERENTLNALLVEMDGFKERRGNIIVMASTNVPPDELDSALMRPGRFDKQIWVDKPDLREREEICLVHLAPLLLAPMEKLEEADRFHESHQREMPPALKEKTDESSTVAAEEDATAAKLGTAESSKTEEGTGPAAPKVPVNQVDEATAAKEDGQMKTRANNLPSELRSSIMDAFAKASEVSVLDEQLRCISDQLKAYVAPVSGDLPQSELEAKEKLLATSLLAVDPKVFKVRPHLVILISHSQAETLEAAAEETVALPDTSIEDVRKRLRNLIGTLTEIVHTPRELEDVTMMVAALSKILEYFDDSFDDVEVARNALFVIASLVEKALRTLPTIQKACVVAEDTARTQSGAWIGDTEEVAPETPAQKYVTPTGLPTANPANVMIKCARRIAQLSPGMTGAEIMNICNEGALLAARRSHEYVTLDDLEASMDRVIAGLENRSRRLSDFERNVVAFHEAGHAVVGWFSENCDPLVKISIVPRGSSALGYAQYLPDEALLRTEDQLFHNACMTLGGRASEWVHFGHLSTGASDDLRKVTQIAYASVSTYGMVGRCDSSRVRTPRRNVSFPPPAELEVRKPYSEAFAVTLDEEVRSFLTSAFNAAVDLCIERREEIRRVAEWLLHYEVVTQDEFVRLVGPRPFRKEDELECIAEK